MADKSRPRVVYPTVFYFEEADADLGVVVTRLSGEHAKSEV